MPANTSNTTTNQSKPTTIYAKIIKFQKTAPVITKKEINPFYKSKYASLDRIQQTIRDALADAGLGYSQQPTAEGLKTIIFDAEGNTIEFVYPMSATGGPQETGSAITYAKRYSLVAALGLIVEDEDDDGNKAQNQTQEPQKAQNQTQEPQKQVQEQKQKQVFWKITLPDVIDDNWVNNIIYGLSKAETRDKALVLFKRIKAENKKIDDVLYAKLEKAVKEVYTNNNTTTKNTKTESSGGYAYFTT